MIETVASVIVARAVGDVFAFVTRVENMPQWVRGARVARESAGPIGDGSVFHEGDVAVRVSHFQVNAGFETESVAIRFPTSLALRRMHGLLRFEPTGHDTRFTLTHRFELTKVAQPLRSLIARRARRESQDAVDQLRKVLEV